MNYGFVVPKAGMIVRDPVSKLALPAEGKRVKLDSYWRRRVLDGDVTLQSEESSQPVVESQPQSNEGQGE